MKCIPKLLKTHFSYILLIPVKYSIVSNNKILSSENKTKHIFDPQQHTARHLKLAYMASYGALLILHHCFHDV